MGREREREREYEREIGRESVQGADLVEAVVHFLFFEDDASLLTVRPREQSLRERKHQRERERERERDREGEIDGEREK